MLLLHARGAKTGEPRRDAAAVHAARPGLILVASKAGAERHPAWYHNLTAHPDIEVEVDGRLIPVLAHEAEGE